MKKVPSARFPEPRAGVIRSEHPRAIGVNGLVDASNLIKRDGVVRVRDGLEVAVTPAYDGVSDGNSIVGLGSFDYQSDGTIVRDNLVVVTNDAVCCYDTSLASEYKATADDIDWTLGGTYGTGIVAGQDYVVEAGVTVDFTNIDWSKFNAATDALFVRLNVMFSGPSGVFIEAFEVRDITGSPSTVKVATLDWATITTGTKALLPSSKIEKSADLGEVFVVDVGDADTGIRVAFNKVWGEWYDNWKAAGGESGNISDDDNDLFFYAAIFRAGTDQWGIPGQADVVEIDSTDRPVMRAWDFEQKTHVLIAAEDEFMLDLDMDMNGGPTPTIELCGSAGECPRAKAIGIAAQRIIAGNVSYFDPEATLEAFSYPLTGAYNDNGSPNFHQIYQNEEFAYFPDAVVFSGTVLTGGHKKWYPGDIIRLADTPGEIVAIQEMGLQQAAIYKSDAIYTLTAQSGLSPFVPSIRASYIQGPVSPRAIVSLNDSTHMYLGRDGNVYIFSGGAPQSIGSQFGAWINREIDVENSGNSFMVFDEDNEEVHVYYPVKGSEAVVRKGLIIDVSNQPYTGWPVMYSDIPDDGQAADSFEQGFLCAATHFMGDQNVAIGDITYPTKAALGTLTAKYRRLLFGMEWSPRVTSSRDSQSPAIRNAHIYNTADNGNDFGEAIIAYAETGTTDFGDPDANKVLLEIELMIDPIEDDDDSPDITITIFGGNSNRKLKQLWQGSVDLDTMVARPRVRARYFSYKIQVTAPVDSGLSPLGDIQLGGAIARFKLSGYRNDRV